MSSISWIVIAAAAPLLWAVVNHIDKYFLSDKFSHAKVGITGGLMIFSTLFSICVLPVLYILDSTVFSIQLNIVLLLVFMGVTSALSILFYLKALDKDEVSIVVPIFQTIPVFALMFGYILLGETLNTGQLVGMVVVIIFSVMLTLEINSEAKIHFKKEVLVLSLAAAGLFSLGETVFKVGAIQSNLIQALFWEHVGLLLFGLILICIGNYRRSFIALVRKNFTSITALNLGSEAITVLGNTLTKYALMMAPVALVMTIAGLQPIFAFFIGIILTIFAPNISKEKITLVHISHKVGCIVLIIIGTSIIVLYT